MLAWIIIIMLIAGPLLCWGIIAALFAWGIKGIKNVDQETIDDSVESAVFQDIL